jgi:outer membrane immunogenic protein
MRLRLLAFAVAALVGNVPMQAQDWSGYFAGAHAGHTSRTPAFTERNFDAGTLTALDSNGASAGLLFGYDTAFRGAIFGVEADLGLLNPGESLVGSRSDGNYNTFDMKWNAATSVRAGWPFHSSLIYGTAGLAMASFSSTDAFRDELESGVDQKTSTMVGWSVGAGIQRPVASRLMIRLEAKYANYGSEQFGSDPGTGEWTPTTFNIRIGVAYRF